MMSLTDVSELLVIFVNRCIFRTHSITHHILESIGIIFKLEKFSALRLCQGLYGMAVPGVPRAKFGLRRNILWQAQEFCDIVRIPNL